MRHLAFGLVVILAACSDPAPPPPPANAIEPGRIDYFDITQNKLYGSGCNFVAEGGGIGAILMALEADAVLKLGGKLVKIPADKASEPLKQGSWTRYAGPAYTLTIAPVADGKGKVVGVVETLTAQIILRNPSGKTLFAAKGEAQCKPM